jgi:hypothetical protein
MRHALRLSLLAGLSAALFACGPGAKLGGGKEGAASALFSATAPTKSAGSIFQYAGQNLDLQGGATVSCQYGGKATLKAAGVNVNTGGGGVSVKTTYNVTYDNCATATHENNNVVLTGTMTVTQDISVSGTSGNVSQTLKGKVTFGGAFNDYLDANIVQTVDWAKMGATGGSVSITLDGTLATSSESYTYSNESVTITAGTLVAASK